MKYKVTITEVLSRVINVEAENEEDAVKKIEKQYWCGDIVLDSSDYGYTSFEAEEVE